MSQLAAKYFILYLCLLLGGICAGSAQAQESVFDFRLSTPVDCTNADYCFVQNYMDHDPGPDWLDYKCRHLSYDNHNGTDIRVSFADMNRGIPVLAVADGLVIGTRDGMDDVNVNALGVGELHGKFAGNAVFIDHNGGIETQYSHLKKGSVRVHPGDFVKRGDMVGMVGLSGNTVFPHVEFGLFVSGTYVDPFVGEHPGQGCGVERMPLWDEEAQALLSYRPRGELDADFANGVPDLKTVLYRAKRQFQPEGNREMTFWASMFGVRKGDRLVIRIIGPGGQRIAQTEKVIDRNLAEKTVYISKKQASKRWRSGIYQGECVLTPVEAPEATLVIRRQLLVPPEFVKVAGDTMSP